MQKHVFSSIALLAFFPYQIVDLQIQREREFGRGQPYNFYALGLTDFK